MLPHLPYSPSGARYSGFPRSRGQDNNHPSPPNPTVPRSLEYGSHAAAPAVLTIGGEVQRFPPVTGIGYGYCLERLPGGSAQLQPWYHVLNGLPYPLFMRVSRSLECGSHAAAPAVHTTRRVVHRSPYWSRRSRMCSRRSSSRSEMNELPVRRRVVAPGSCLRTSGHVQHLPAVGMIPARRLEARATRSACSPA